jgi:hypothetical protein
MEHGVALFRSGSIAAKRNKAAPKSGFAGKQCGLVEDGSHGFA